MFETNLLYHQAVSLSWLNNNVHADKPPIADLPYFLDFQAHKIWAPVHNDLPLGPPRNKAASTPALHFKMMGPTLFVNNTKVIAGKRPVTGMRLYLEGMKSNRLAIHLQHLISTPTTLENKISDSATWKGSYEVASANSAYFEPIQGKRFSHVCTGPVELKPDRVSSPRKDRPAFIVTGAQLLVNKHGSKTALHLRLLFSEVFNSCILQSNWTQCSSGFSQKSGFFSAISTSISGGAERGKQAVMVVDSAVFPTGPPAPVPTQKLSKFVELSELCKGPQDSPGHWLATGGRLELEKGKICLSVKFSLLHVFS